MALKAQQVEFLISANPSLAGGSATFYTAGSSHADADKKTVWQDRNKTTPAANPVSLDAVNGTAVVFGDGVYDVVLKTAAGAALNIVNLEIASKTSTTFYSVSNDFGGSLADAVASPLTAGKRIVVDTVIDVAAVTVPTDREIEIVKGGKIRYSGALAILGSILAGLWQCFESSGGTVSIAGNIPVKASWFPDVNTATNSGSLSVELSPNTIYPTTGLTISRNYQRIWGHGPTSIIALSNASNSDVLTVSTSIIYATVENLRIDGNKDNQTSASNGITFSGGNHYTNVSNVRFTNIKTIGVEYKTADACNFNQVRGCSFWNGASVAAVSVGLGTKNIISSNAFDSLTGIAVKLITANSNTVSENYIETCIDGIFIGKNSCGTFAAVNYIKSWSGFGVNLEDFTLGNTIQGNFFSNNDAVRSTCINPLGKNNVLGPLNTFLSIEGGTVTPLARGTHVNMQAVGMYANAGRWLESQRLYNLSSFSLTSGIGEQDLINYMLTGTTLSSRSALRIEVAGEKIGVAGAKTIIFYFGSASVTLIAAETTAGDWRATIDIKNIAATNSQYVSVNAVSGVTVVANSITTAAIDTAADQTIRVTGNCANIADSIKAKFAVIKFPTDDI